MKYGSKIDNLLFLKEKGFNVPDFTVVSFEDAFDDHDSLAGLMDETVKHDKNALAQTVENFVKKNIKKTFGVRLDGENFAVRSSCSIEDGDKDSFAGQFDTFLNVKPCELDEKITDCFFSLFNKNVIDYMFEKSISADDIRMNVIVQKMVSSELSGIVFSANPQGLLNESVIVVGRGLGENVVTDKVDTTSYYYNLTDKVFYFEGREDLLSKETVEELIEISQDISKLLFDFSDVEFAVENGEIFILQARKITTLDACDPLIFDNSNIVESYPGISLPLTVSLVKMVYS
ncbi:MAG: phosphoenolpyruvate synthase, partial [Clostridia bacterium]|nr:phosphoenolpyruvate synthase [Clostridia bacterium]